MTTKPNNSGGTISAARAPYPHRTRRRSNSTTRKANPPVSQDVTFRVGDLAALATTRKSAVVRSKGRTPNRPHLPADAGTGLSRVGMTPGPGRFGRARADHVSSKLKAGAGLQVLHLGRSTYRIAANRR